MEMSFFALPSQQGPVQGRFKPAHRLISLSTKVSACVRRFETPTPLNYGRTESKKDISMLTGPFFMCEPGAPFGLELMAEKLMALSEQSKGKIEGPGEGNAEGARMPCTQVAEKTSP